MDLGKNNLKVTALYDAGPSTPAAMQSERRNAGVIALLFDLDNTLIATRKADKLACTKLAEILWEKYAVPNDLASNICKTYLKAFRKCPENLTMSLDSWRHLLWKQALGEQYSNLAENVYQTWLHLRYEFLALTPDIRNLLQKLRQHYFMGVITNGTSSAQWEKIKLLNLGPHFDVILVSGDLPWEKPHPKIFYEVCNYLGVKPQQCIMIGDKLETDILGGIRAEFAGTVWVPLTTAELEDSDPSPDFIIKSILDLPSILPNNPKVPRFRRKSFSYSSRKSFSIADFDDSNSNSSDGS